MSERTAVYRLYAADAALLYVGVSNRIGRRWEQHAAVQPWWPSVHHQSVEWHPTREDALMAEKRAIVAERPVHNRRGSPWEAHAKDDGTGFWIVAKPPPERADYHRESPVTVRMPVPVLERLNKRAKEAGRSRSALIIEAVSEKLDREAVGP